MRPITWSRPDARRSRPALILDRDGVINRRVIGGYVYRPEDLCFHHDLVSSLRDCISHYTPIYIASNQSCIGRGVATLDDVHETMLTVIRHLAINNILVDGYVVCPHRPDDGCYCRKPKPGLLYECAQRFSIPLNRSVFLGDSLCDATAGIAAGCHTLLVREGDEISYQAMIRAASALLKSEEEVGVNVSVA